MAIEIPLWLSGGTYSARLDRQIIKRWSLSKERVFEGLLVAQRAAGANFTVDVSIGACVITGDNEANQGMYLVETTAIENFAMPVKPTTNPRIDLVSMRINDPGAGGPAGNTATLVATSGAEAATPVAPAVPTSAILLAQISRTVAEGSILTAAITDKRAVSQGPVNVVAAVPSTLGVVGDVYFVVP